MTHCELMRWMVGLQAASVAPRIIGYRIHLLCLDKGHPDEADSGRMLVLDLTV